ncbi:hypothetical protein HDU99_000798, partial [Rhizoclosmatium hyalinum]
TLSNDGDDSDPEQRAAALEAFFDGDGAENEATRALASVKAVLGGSPAHTTFEEYEQESKNLKYQATLSHLSKTIRFSANKPAIISRRIARFLATTTRKSSAVQTSSSIWPLVKRACVYGPWGLLSGGLVLVDLPGLGDENSARNQVVSHYISNCNALLAVAPITRAQDNKVTKDLLLSDLVRENIKNGNLSYVGFVATHSDSVDPREIIDELEGDFVKFWKVGCEMVNMPVPVFVRESDGNDDNGTTKVYAKKALQTLEDYKKKVGMMRENGIPVDEAIENNIARISRMLRHSCVTARNGFVADGLRRQYTQDMADILAQANALDLHYGVTQLQVFCVSSISYDMIMREGGGSASISPTFLNVEATGIPALLDVLWDYAEVDDSVQVEAKQEMLKAFASKKKTGTTSYEHDDDDEENDEELMEEGEGGNNDLAATSEAQEKLNDFLTQIMQDDRADDGEDIAPEALRQRMEREAKENEELRQSRVESSTQSLQERTVYLNKVIKTNNVAAATLSKFIDSISCVQGQKTVASDRRIQIWKSQVRDLVDSNTSTATSTGSNGNVGAAMIAVLGDSGSGKSSLLNALLVPKSDGILPVSGARACTAAPIEIAYHASREFEAKVEFLKKDEWYPELELLLGDLADENGNLKKNMMRPSSENGRIAYDKVMSVYGRIATFDELTRKGGLMEGRLGSVVTLRASTEEGIRSRLEAFVSSKTSRSDVILESEVGRLWPIVKYAVLSGPFPLLADSGGRLLDLPGLQDANAARNAVVEAFLTKCTGFLIAAPIKR